LRAPLRKSRINAYSGKLGKVDLKCSRRLERENMERGAFRLAERVGVTLRNISPVAPLLGARRHKI
jgi:hypothetical protein